MTLKELKNSIYYKNFYHFLIFYGEESYIKQRYLDEMSKVWVRVSNCDDVQFRATGFIKKQQFYRIDGEALLEKDKKEWEDIKNKCLYSNNVYVFDFSDNSFLRHKTFTEYFKDYLIQFEHVSERLLLKYFKSSGLSEEYLKRLFAYNNNDYSSIDLEIKKINSYAAENKISKDIAFDTLFKSGYLNYPIGDMLFKYTGAILAKNNEEINRFLFWIKQTPEPLLGIIKSLYKQFTTLYYVQLIEQIKDKEERQRLFIDLKLCKEDGKPGRLYYLRQDLARYKDISKILDILQSTENGIMQGDFSDEHEALDYMTMQIISI